MFLGNLENFPYTLVKVLDEAEVPENLEPGHVANKEVPTYFSETIHLREEPNKTQVWVGVLEFLAFFWT